MPHLGPAIDALEHDGVHIFAQLGNGRVELHAVLLGERIGKLINAPGAGRNIRTATAKGGRDPCIGQRSLGLGIVNDLGKGGDVGGIQPDQANADFLGGGHGHQGKREDEGKQTCHAPRLLPQEVL